MKYAEIEDYLESLPAVAVGITPDIKNDSPVPGDNIVLGDVNSSGAIDMLDYILLKRAYFGTFTLEGNARISGDVNKNGDIDMLDYILLKRAYFGTYTIE